MGWENGKNGRDKQWHTTTRVVGRKTHGRQNVVCICYTIATRHKPSRRQRERASNRWWAGWLAALSPWLVLSGHFITWSGTHTLYVNAARAHSRSRTPWSEIGTPPCRHISFFARLSIPLVQNFRAEHTLLHGLCGGDSHIFLES